MSKPDKRTDKRTTVSLAWVVWEMAEEMMRIKGFNDNFSAYVADLIRRDKERANTSKGDCPPNLSSSNYQGGDGPLAEKGKNPKAA